MYTLIFLPEANKDISDISRYIGVELCNPAAADKLVDKIISETEKLTEMPYMYSIYEPLFPLSFEYRKFTVKNYTIFFTLLTKAKKTVNIAHVVYAKRNFSNVIK